MRIGGVILAGGLARRMGGGDKGLATLNGKPLISHCVERLAPQVSAIAINANGDPERFAFLDLPVVADPLPDHPGPLAGILAGLQWAQENALDAVVSMPADTPFFPNDLVANLANEAAPITLARSLERTHPVVGLWYVGIMSDLEQFLRKAETRKILAFVDCHDNATVTFQDVEGIDPFFNINTPDDLAAARSVMGDKK